MQQPALLTQEQAAAFLGLSPRTLEAWRRTSHGPAFVRIGPRRVRYRQETIQAWLTAQEVTQGNPSAPTSPLQSPAHV